jgi:hypothetical protein
MCDSDATLVAPRGLFDWSIARVIVLIVLSLEIQ